jgi:hypothetical protein
MNGFNNNNNKLTDVNVCEETKIEGHVSEIRGEFQRVQVKEDGWGTNQLQQPCICSA